MDRLVNAHRTQPPLRLFLPGAFASLSRRIEAAFSTVEPDLPLWFHPFVPSGTLAREILDGAEADIYVSANRHYMRTLDEAGLVHRSAVLAGNRLCVIRSLRLAGDDGLGWRIIERPDTRVVTPQSLTDPCGQYVAALFLRASLTDVMEAKERAGTLIHSFGSGDLPGYLADGRADAGIFYLSEALTLGGAVRIDPLPPALDFHQAITFMIGMVSQDPLRWPLARACFDFLAGDDGQALLAEAGFLPAALVPASSAV